MSRHIIHTQKVHLQIAKEGHAWELQNRVSNLLKEGVLPSLQSLFDEISPNGEILRIEKVAVNLGNLTEQNLETEFTQKLTEQLREILASQKRDISGYTANSAPDKLSKIEEKQSLLDTLVYFLNHGYMPWHSAATDMAAWEETIMDSFTEREWEKLISVLKQEMKTSRSALKRLTYQFSGSFLQQFLLAIIPSLTGTVWNAIYSDVHFVLNKLQFPLLDSAASGKLTYFIWQKALSVTLRLGNRNDFELKLVQEIFARAWIREKAKEILNLKGTTWMEVLQSEKIRDSLEQIFHEINKLETSIETTAKENEKNTAVADEMAEQQESETGKKHGARNVKKQQWAIDKDDALYPVNCGLVILHPFLQMFFEELGITEQNHFKDETARQRAVLLLHYLATGESKVPEIHLLLPKLLCAMDIEEPVENEIELTEKEMEESSNLLKSVLKHWAPLNRTSVQGLQQTFLQREGKLTLQENGWLLQIEQKTVDILMNKLPWGIGAIKLPWMNKFLHVEWC